MDFFGRRPDTEVLAGVPVLGGGVVGVSLAVGGGQPGGTVGVIVLPVQYLAVGSLEVDGGLALGEEDVIDRPVARGVVLHELLASNSAELGAESKSLRTCLRSSSGPMMVRRWSLWFRIIPGYQQRWAGRSPVLGHAPR